MKICCAAMIGITTIVGALPCAATITSIVGFGDSLTDTGRIGRFSDGILWIEQLASQLGVPTPIPSSSGGTNYAHGGATTGDSTVLPVPDMYEQVADYLASNTSSTQALYLLWGGHNDLFGGVAPSTIVGNLSAQVSALYAAGARQFVVPTLVPLDLTPRERVGANKAALAAAVSLTNSLLMTELNALESTLVDSVVYQPDIYGLFTEMFADFMVSGSSGQYGFENVTDAALLTGGDVTTHMWIDPIHPTNKTHVIIGNYVASAIPEPSSLALLLLGSLSLFTRYRQAAPV